MTGSTTELSKLRVALASGSAIGEYQTCYAWENSLHGAYYGKFSHKGPGDRSRPELFPSTVYGCELNSDATGS
jgi:hypothetical protein